MYCTGDPVNYYDPTGATIDVDGDGKLDSEDSITQTYIYMKPSNPNYAAQEQKMVDAVAAATARAAALAERERIGRNLDILAGWLAGFATAAAAVSAGAGTLALGSAGAAAATAPTVIGPLAGGAGAAGFAQVAVLAGVASLVAGIGYAWVTEARVERGYVSPDDVRASAEFDFLSTSAGVAGLGSYSCSVVGLGLSGGIAAVEYSRF